MGSSIWKTDPRTGVNNRRNSFIAFGVAILMIVGIAAWDYSQTYARSYSGELVEKERKFRWWRGNENWHGPEYRRYNHYWIVETDDGRQVRGRASRFRYNDAEIGDEIIKERGERFPRVVDDGAPSTLFW